MHISFYSSSSSGSGLLISNLIQTKAPSILWTFSLLPSTASALSGQTYFKTVFYLLFCRVSTYLMSEWRYYSQSSPFLRLLRTCVMFSSSAICSSTYECRLLHATWIAWMVLTRSDNARAILSKLQSLLSPDSFCVLYCYRSVVAISANFQRTDLPMTFISN